jgi:DNA polymerase-3 subunit delta'
VPIVPLYGHAVIRDRLREAIGRGTLPASLLLHGPRGIGKQRLALWLGELLLCTAEPESERPCGRCQSCRYAGQLAHPDLHWYFPRARLKEADSSPDEVRADYMEALTERAKAGGLYAAPSGAEGIFVATVRALVGEAAMAPALGRRKVFVVGDAERMVPQEGSDYAANAFLKLLEEPPADTTIIVTSSEPGALLPTIRSRVVAIRVPALPDAEVRQFLRDERVSAALDAEGSGGSLEERVREAGGAPGTLFGGQSRDEARAAAARLLDAARGERAAQLRLAFAQGASRARGAYSDTLDELTLLLHERSRQAVADHDAGRAFGAARAVELVERAKARASGNVSPQLITAELLRELGALVR